MKLTVKTLSLIAALMLSATAAAQDKPNILVIWGDDIGYWNVSHNNRGYKHNCK